MVHGDGCSCQDCTNPEQSYCDSCQGPLQPDGGGWFRTHDFKDCIAWLARKSQFSEPVVFPGCRPARDHECRKAGGHDFRDDGWCSRCGLWDKTRPVYSQTHDE